MVVLENETFLFELTRMFTKSKQSAKGSVTITCKQHIAKPKSPAKKYTGAKKGQEAKGDKSRKEPEGAAAAGAPAEPVCLFRATLGSKKISTIVSAKEVGRFQQSFGTLLKGNIDGLKRKDKKKKDKEESKDAADKGKTKAKGKEKDGNASDA